MLHGPGLEKYEKEQEGERERPCGQIHLENVIEYIPLQPPPLVDS